jgi:hypothetical protein
LKQQAALQFSESCLGDFGWPEVGDFEVAIGGLKRQLTRLDIAKVQEDMNVPGWKFHPLSTGHWSVWVNDGRI